MLILEASALGIQISFNSSCESLRRAYFEGAILQAAMLRIISGDYCLENSVKSESPERRVVKQQLEIPV